MANTQNKKHLRQLIILSALTTAAWNIELFLTLLAIILPDFDPNASFLAPSNPISLLIWAGAFFATLLLPFILLCYCIAKLADNRQAQDKMKSYQTVWFAGILALNVLFYARFPWLF